MKDHHDAYLRDLRARNERDLGQLARALAGRRPRLLQATIGRQRAVEAETARILEQARQRGQECVQNAGERP